MKDLNRQRFEDSWREAFDGAEAEPSASVWSNVELDLVRGESDSMKKKVVFYKWLAAASVFLVVFLGGTFYYSSKTGDQQIGATETEPIKNSNLKPKNASTESHGDKNTASIADNALNSKSGSVRREKSKNGLGLESKPNQSTTALSPAIIAPEKRDEIFQTQIQRVNNTSKRGHESVTFQSIVEEVPAVVHGKIELPRLVLPAMPASFMASTKKEQAKEDLWASVGVAAGSYNPDYGISNKSAYSAVASPNDALTSSSSGYSNPSNVGSAYSAGFAMSKRVFTRWVIQGGANYINQNIGYTSNYVTSSGNSQTKVSVTEYTDFSNQSVTITTPYQINSAVEVVSLPLQTGYLLIDRKIGWQLNTGMAADFFVRNTLTDQSGNADRFTQSTGSDSPYRAVSWSGLLGTELSYKVAKQYRVSVVPSMRYSVNSVLKSTSGLSSNPLVMDIGFRFRYIFNK